MIIGDHLTWPIVHAGILSVNVAPDFFPLLPYGDLYGNTQTEWQRDFDEQFYWEL